MRRSSYSLLGAATALIALASAGLVAQGKPSAPLSPLPDLLARAASYLDDYEARFSAVMSQEDYRQRSTSLVGPSPGVPSLQTRDTKAELLILNAGSGAWLCFRDVFEVDGKTLPNHVQRLATLLAAPGGDSTGAASEANQIAVESARYNLGPTRNLNVPTMALTFLKREQQARSSFRDSGTQKEGERERVQIVSFTENARPTIVRGAKGRDVPAIGRFWIEASGRIDRTELVLSDDDLDAKITVVYGPQPKLGVWVPSSMAEQYEVVGTFERTDAVANYSHFAVPTVSVDVAGFKAAVGRGRGGGTKPRR
jgi:hypothetical protein